MKKNDLEFLQSLSEAEFTELVVIPLLEAMGYSEIRYTHGPAEFGKDVVFRSENPLEGDTYFAATIKCKRMTGSMSSSHSIREVAYQAGQSQSEPFVDPVSGKQITIDKTYIVNPFPVPQTTIRSIGSELRQKEHRLVFIDGPALIHLIDQHVPTLLQTLPNPEARYLHVLCRRFMDHSRLARLGSDRALSLIDIYTGGDVSPISPAEAKFLSFAVETPVSARLHPEIELSNSHCSIVLADVGAGKTTLLQRLTLSMSEGQFDRDMVPLFVPLSVASLRWLSSFNHFKQGLEHYLRVDQGFETFSYEHAQRYCLFLDGFDELIDRHEAVERFIEELSRDFGRVVMTSRPSRIPNLKCKTGYFRLNPFSDENIKTFLCKWFPHNRELQASLYSRIVTSGVLHQFCRSPLLLTLCAILANRVSLDSLPTRRTDIYARIVQMLLGEWDRMRTVINRFSADVKRNVLESLAFSIHVQKRAIFSQVEIEREIQAILKHQNSDEEDKQELLNELIFRSSLIRQNSDGAFEFVHLSFQEYLCASRLARVGAKDVIRDGFMDQWWKNTLIFLFGITRSVDTVEIPRAARKSRGAGLRMMEFMQEADFTSTAARERALSAVGKELLNGGRVTDGELAICTRLGDDLVQLLNTQVTRDAFDGNYSNYCKVLAAMNSPKAMESLVGNKTLLSKLVLSETIQLVSDIFGSVRGDKDTEFLCDALLSIGRQCESLARKQAAEDRIAAYLNTKQLAGKLRQWISRKPVDQRNVAKILKNLNAINDFAPHLLRLTAPDLAKLSSARLIRSLTLLVKCVTSNEHLLERDIASECTRALIARLPTDSTGSNLLAKCREFANETEWMAHDQMGRQWESLRSRLNRELGID